MCRSRLTNQLGLPCTRLSCIIEHRVSHARTGLEEPVLEVFTTCLWAWRRLFRAASANETRSEFIHHCTNQKCEKSNDQVHPLVPLALRSNTFDSLRAETPQQILVSGGHWLGDGGSCFYRPFNKDTATQRESIRKLAGLRDVTLLCTAHTGCTEDYARAMKDWHPAEDAGSPTVTDQRTERHPGESK